MDFLDDLDEEDSNYFPKSKRTTIDIPTFVEKKDFPIEEETAAVLNNVPGNVELEEIQHLNGIEKIAINLTEEEWIRYLFYAPHELLTREIDRRLKSNDTINDSVKSLKDFLDKVKM